MRQPKRDPLPVRFERFSNTNTLVSLLRNIHSTNPSTEALEALQIAERLQVLGQQEETAARIQEQDELLENLHKYPHAIRTWVTYYQAKELE